MKPLVSIIIPAYNSERWIAHTILSAKQQTWANTETIIVDDGSTDNTLAVAQSFASDRVRIVRQENKGASAARNSGLSVAKGEYIQFLDADDVLATDKIERQMKAVAAFGHEYIYSSSWGYFTKNINKHIVVKHQLCQHYDSPIDYLVTSWMNNIWMASHSYLVPRAIMVKAGGWNETISRNDDGEYFCRVLLASKGVRFCPDALCYYRRGTVTSLSSQLNHKNALSDLRTFELYEQYIKQVEESERVRKACAANFQNFIFFFFPKHKDLLRVAERHVQRLGGSEVKPIIPESYVALAKVIGWKWARRLELWAYANNLNRTYLKKKLKSIAQLKAYV
jgi:glycosyltransferase involved in cell wall biosynthesis